MQAEKGIGDATPRQGSFETLFCVNDEKVVIWEAEGNAAAVGVAGGVILGALV